jgi:hypothetical protein
MMAALEDNSWQRWCHLLRNAVSHCGVAHECAAKPLSMSEKKITRGGIPDETNKPYRVHGYSEFLDSYFVECGSGAVIFSGLERVSFLVNFWGCA